SGRSAADVIGAYSVVRGGFDLPTLFAKIDGLDGKIYGDGQLELYQAVGRLVHSATLWQLRNDIGPWRLDERIAALRTARAALEHRIGDKVAPATRERLDERAHALFKAGAPDELARRIAWLNIAELIPDIARVAGEAN